MIFEEQCALLIDSCLILLLAMLKRGNQIKPWQWLRYQLFSDGDVAFRSLFHCLLLARNDDPFGYRNLDD